MEERDERLKFWIRGSNSNPIGVINELQSRMEAPINIYDFGVERFADPNIVWYIRKFWNGNIAVECLDVTTDYAEWLMAAWPEIRPEDSAPARIYTVAITPKKDVDAECRDCQYKRICDSEKLDAWSQIFPFPYLPCAQNLEVWDNPESAREHYGI